jgi:hypothetical protein
VRLAFTRVRLVTTVLGMVNVCVLALLINRAWYGTQTVSLLATTPKPFAIPELGVTVPNRAGSLASIQEQSLFYASRHFYTPPLPSALPATPPKPDYRLVGTFIIPAKPTIALLSNSSGASRKVKPGDELDGWTVAAVEGGRVILQYGSSTFEISNASKAGNAGMQAVSLQRTAQVAPTGGVRTLGSPAQGASVPQAGFATPNSSPRLYRPPPQ